MPTYHDDTHPFDVWKVRKDFPMLAKTMNGKPLIYLDTAATAQKPSSVIETINRFYREEYGTVHRAIYEIAARSTEMYSEVRTKVQNFINAPREEEIIFTRGTTESINLVAHSFARAFLKEGDEILISEMEHHSNIVPWQIVCDMYKTVLKVTPITDTAELNLDAFKDLLTHKTKLVSLAHIANATGTINPVKEVISLAHQAGAKVLIDGAQAAPHLMIDVQDLDADFYAFSGHKLYGPTGVGVLYGKKELLEAMPPFFGGGDMIEEVTFEKTTFQPIPLKFEAGTPSIAEVIGLGAAIDYVESIGRLAIHKWEQKLLTYATEKLQSVAGIKLFGTAPSKSGIVSFTVEGMHPLDLGTILGLKGIAIRTGHLCAQPVLRHLGVEALARISFGIYNTYEDIDSFLHALKEATILLKPEMSY
ncbi:MAG: cysteine desulfurase [Simkania sp.]|nr:cysteine desulfurase [Simkania sp.]